MKRREGAIAFAEDRVEVGRGPGAPNEEDVDDVGVSLDQGAKPLRASGGVVGTIEPGELLELASGGTIETAAKLDGKIIMNRLVIAPEDGVRLRADPAIEMEEGIGSKGGLRLGQQSGDAIAGPQGRRASEKIAAALAA